MSFLQIGRRTVVPLAHLGRLRYYRREVKIVLDRGPRACYRIKDRGGYHGTKEDSTSKEKENKDKVAILR